MRLDIDTQLELVNASLRYFAKLGSPPSEIDSVKLSDGENGTVKLFGMNGESLEASLQYNEEQIEWEVISHTGQIE